jgi:hypothetical protein
MKSKILAIKYPKQSAKEVEEDERVSQKICKPKQTKLD